MIKVLHIVDSAGFYGAESMIVALSLEQLKQGIKPIICGIVKKGELDSDVVKRARKLGLEAISLPLYGSLFEQRDLVYRCAEECLVDVIHSHGYRPSILLGLFRGERKAILVRTLHGWTHTSIFSRVFFYTLLDTVLLWRQNAVAIVSQNMRKRIFLKLLPYSKIVHIPNGIPIVDEVKVIDMVSEEWQNQGCFVVGAIGRLSEEKAQKDMIKAVSILRAKSIPVSLVIIGEGRERVALEAWAKELGISDYVHLLGYRENAASFMSFFDILCISSLTEGLPITLLEAMRHGLPVLSTAVGDVPDLLADGRGYLVNPSDAVSLAFHIEESRRNPSLSRKVSKAAGVYFRCHYSSTVMAKSYLDMYTVALNRF